MMNRLTHTAARRAVTTTSCGGSNSAARVLLSSKNLRMLSSVQTSDRYIAYDGNFSKATRETDPFVCPSEKVTGVDHPERDPSWTANDAYHPVFETPFKHNRRVRGMFIAIFGTASGATLFLYWFAQKKAGIF